MRRDGSSTKNAETLDDSRKEAFCAKLSQQIHTAIQMLHIQTQICMNQILLECFVQDKIRKKMLCMTKIVIFTSKFHLQTQINCVSLLFYYVAGLLLVSNSISDFAISERIIGGTVASHADFPFLVKQRAQKILLHN